MAQNPTQNDEMLAEVNVIPLADLSLVLLIILMVISPIVTQAIIQVSAAQAKRAETQGELATPETPVIVSFAPGALKLNGAVMGSDLEFVNRLEQILMTRRDKAVYLTASPEVTHGKVVHVLDLVKRHGATNLVILKWDDEKEAA